MAHAVSLHYMHYNFARVHQSLTVMNDDGSTTKRTPAMAAGVTDHVWTLREIAALPRLRARLVNVMESGRPRESGMRWALRFFGLNREHRQRPVSRQETLAGLVLVVIGLVVLLATNPSRHAFSLHRVAVVVLGVGLGSTVGGGIRRWRAKRANSN